MFNLDDTEIQVFHQLQAKLKDVLKDVKAIIGAHKKGQGKSGKASYTVGMDAKWLRYRDSVWTFT